MITDVKFYVSITRCVCFSVNHSLTLSSLRSLRKYVRVCSSLLALPLLSKALLTHLRTHSLISFQPVVVHCARRRRRRRVHTRRLHHQAVILSERDAYQRDPIGRSVGLMAGCWGALSSPECGCAGRLPVRRCDVVEVVSTVGVRIIERVLY
jgi:hypothetical protein